jgi:hypothetical protein
MPRRPDPSLYEKLVGRLEGDAFQDEACVRLQRLFADFQRVPAKPSGDGGLDGLSHGQERCYCCYGPEQDPIKVKIKDLKDDIVKKFNADLRKLFELDFDPKQQLVNAPNAELATILGAGNKIKNIYLVLSWFETHRVIGPLNTHFAKCMKASKLQYIHADAKLTIWGPKDLSTLGEIDEHTLFRIENPTLFQRVQSASAATLIQGVGGDFDAKFDDLKLRRPARSEHIDKLAQTFREAWAAAIALDNELASTSVGLHEALESARTDAARSALVRSMSEDEPHKLINAMREDVVQRLGQGFGDRLGSLTSKVADGVVAGLIGECPLEWRDESA